MSSIIELGLTAQQVNIWVGLTEISSGDVIRLDSGDIFPTNHPTWHPNPKMFGGQWDCFIIYTPLQSINRNCLQ